MKKISILIGIFVLIALLVGSFFVYIKINQLPKEDGSNNQTKDVSVQTSTIYGDWVWSHMVDAKGQKIIPQDPSRFVLTLSSEGKLTSTTDCNTVSGSFVMSENIINIGPLTLTEMGCTGEMLESTYASSLSSISSYSITNNKLIFTLIQNKGSMVFLKK